MGTETNRGATMAVGNVRDRGRAWWAADFEEFHFDGSIPLSVAEMLIGWTPVQVPMMYKNPLTGEAEGYTATDGPMVVLRSDTMEPMGYNGGKSNLFGYWDWFVKGPMRILDASELNLGFVGTFNGGAQAAVQIELEKTIVDDRTSVAFRPFLYAASSIDGSLAPQYGKGYTRIVCENTFSMAKGEAAKSGLFYKLRQTKNARVDDNAAREALQIVHGMTDEITKELHAMCDTEVSDKVFSQFLDTWAAIPEKDNGTKSGGRAYTTAVTKREDITQLWNSDVRVAPWRNTAFGVSQAVTTWSQNINTVRNATRVERNKLNMIKGTATDFEAEAMNTLNLILAAS